MSIIIRFHKLALLLLISVLLTGACNSAPDIGITLEINPSSINSGETTVIKWVVVGATNIYINNGIGDVSPIGEREISPAKTTAYTLTAINVSKVGSKTVTIKVIPGTSTGSQNIPAVIPQSSTENKTGNPPVTPATTPSLPDNKALSTPPVPEAGILAVDHTAAGEIVNQLKTDIKKEGFQIKVIEYFAKGAADITTTWDKIASDQDIKLIQVITFNSDKPAIEKAASTSKYSGRINYTIVKEPRTPDLLYMHYDTSDRNYDIYAIDVDGTNKVNLTGNAANDAWAEWSPTYKKIVFHSNRNRAWPSEYDIFVMDADGTNVTQLTKYGIFGPSCRYPSWSMDGQQITFCKSRTRQIEKLYVSNDSDYLYNVYVMNADGGNIRQLTFSGTKESDTVYHPRFISNTKVSYVFKTNFFRIDSIDTSNNDASTLMDFNNTTPAEENMPVFAVSPDHTKLAYSAYADGARIVYVKDLNKNTTTSLTGAEWQSNNPCWSPDGRNIAVSSTYGIQVVPVDGSAPHRITGTISTDIPCSWKYSAPANTEQVASLPSEGKTGLPENETLIIPEKFSFNPVTYKNSTYGIQIQYPSNWVSYTPPNGCIFMASSFYPTGIYISVMDTDKAITQFNKMATSLGCSDLVELDRQDVLLADGKTHARLIKYSLSYSGYRVTSLNLDADYDGKIVVFAYINLENGFNDAFAKEILSTLIIR
jgi:Tol biopolymer transport system component